MKRVAILSDAGRTVRFRVFCVLVLFLGRLALPGSDSARAAGLYDLAHQVRIIRYAATGNAAPIPGDEDTPANRQAWLDAIAAALGEASGFFHLLGTAPANDKQHGSYTAYSLGAAIDLTVSAGADGVIDEADIDNTITKVTWIVALRYPEYEIYKYHPDVLSGVFGGMSGSGSTRLEALANADPGVSPPGSAWSGICPFGDDPEDLAWYYCNGSLYFFQMVFETDCFQDSFSICAGVMIVNGGYRVPSRADDVPVAGPATPPNAAIDLYYAMPFGPAHPGGLAPALYDTNYLTRDYKPAGVVPAVPACTQESGWIDIPNVAEDGTFDPGTCFARIIEPTLPGGSCPACSHACTLPSPYASTGGPGNSCPSCGSPTWRISKNDLTVTVTDTPIWINPVKGPKLAARMTFHPEHIGESGDFGWGWRWDFAMNIREYGTGIKIVDPGTGRGSWWFISNGDGTWDGPPSAGMTLEQTAGGFTMTKLETGETWTFDSAGKLLSWSNRFGETVSLAYDANGKLETVVGADGASLTLTRDFGGRVTQIAESTGGRTATLTYDDDGFLTSCTDMAGVKCAYQYGHTAAQTDPDKNYPGAITKLSKAVTINGSKDTTFEYSISQTDGQQELKVTDPEGAVTTYRWDHGDTEVFTTIDPNGGMTSELYETIGNRVVLTSKIDALENEWTYEYDSSGFPTTETDPLGNTTAWTRNGLGNPLAVTRPGGAVTTYTYANNGTDLFTETDPLGNVTSYTYDADRNLTAVADPAGQVTSYTYDQEGRKTTETTPTGLTVTYTYDNDGRLVSKSDSLGATTTWTYNARSLAASVATPDGLTVEFTYDTLDRKTSETYLAPDPADNTTVTYTYDCCSLSAKTDRHGATVNYDHDDDGRVVSITDALGNSTTFEYDGNGNRIKTTDALGNETTTAYDLLDRPTTTTYPDATTESFEYDAAGRQTRRTDRAGRVHIVEYDARGNVTARKIEVPGDPDPVTYTLETAAYDLADRRTSSTNALGLTVTYAYDAAGRTLTETYPDQTTVQFQYDAAGMTARTDRLGNTTTYLHDAAGRIVSTSDPLENVTLFTYNGAGRRTALTDALGNQTTYEYDHEGRLIKTTYPDGSTQTRTYAADGLLTCKPGATG